MGFVWNSEYVTLIRRILVERMNIPNSCPAFVKFINVFNVYFGARKQIHAVIDALRLLPLLRIILSHVSVQRTREPFRHL